MLVLVAPLSTQGRGAHSCGPRHMGVGGAGREQHLSTPRCASWKRDNQEGVAGNSQERASYHDGCMQKLAKELSGGEGSSVRTGRKGGGKGIAVLVLDVGRCEGEVISSRSGGTQ